VECGTHGHQGKVGKLADRSNSFSYHQLPISSPIKDDAEVVGQIPETIDYPE
jgi:hypothetical protein